MVYSRMIQFFLVAVCLAVTLGCQQSPTKLQEKRGTKALIQSADGKSYDVACLKSHSPTSMSSCEVGLTDDGEGSGSARGLYSGYYGGDYYYWNLFGFNENDFCGYLWGFSSCYNYFGYTQPSYNYSYGNSCSSSYLYDYYGSLPSYCYWNYDSNTNYTNVRLKLKISPVAGVTTEAAKRIVYLDGAGRVMRKVCTTTNTTSCTTTLIEYLANDMRQAIENFISQSRYGAIVQESTTGTVQCFAMATTTKHYTADNNQIFLRSGNAPCGSETVFYNSSQTGQKLVQKLDSWPAY